jgi:hypothetical protein
MSHLQAVLDNAPHSLVLAAKACGPDSSETPEDYLDGTPIEEFIWFAQREDATRDRSR